jgi:hypothetical protein
MCIAHIELPRGDRSGECDVDAAQAAWRARAASRAVERFDLQRNAAALGRAREQIGIADRDEICG